MNILLANDDGISSPGILKLGECLEAMGAKVTAVAPQMERSTTGHSLTLHKPLRIREVKPNYFYVSGSPADSVYIATRHILKKKPDLIISGINRGANLGRDIYYSGTVAAAREGAFFGIRSMAISLAIMFWTEVDVEHWDTACDFVRKFVPQFLKMPVPDNRVINVNVPNLPAKEIRGVKLGKLGKRIYNESVTESKDPRGKNYYWIGGFLEGHDELEGSDCVHVAQGFVSVVPLTMDSTDYELKDKMTAMENLKL